MNDVIKNVYESALILERCGTASFSGISLSCFVREENTFYTKPIGVDNEGEAMKNVFPFSFENNLPYDISIHAEIYKKFPEVKAVIFFSSALCSEFAKRGHNLPLTTKYSRDYFNYAAYVGCAKCENRGDFLSAVEKISSDRNAVSSAMLVSTTLTYAEKFDAVLWGAELREVVEKAIALERAARIAYPILNFKNKDSGRLF